MAAEINYKAADGKGVSGADEMRLVPAELVVGLCYCEGAMAKKTRRLSAGAWRNLIFGSGWGEREGADARREPERGVGRKS